MKRALITDPRKRLFSKHPLKGGISSSKAWKNMKGWELQPILCWETHPSPYKNGGKNPTSSPRFLYAGPPTISEKFIKPNLRNTPPVHQVIYTKPGGKIPWGKNERNLLLRVVINPKTTLGRGIIFWKQSNWPYSFIPNLSQTGKPFLKIPAFNIRVISKVLLSFNLRTNN